MRLQISAMAAAILWASLGSAANASAASLACPVKDSIRLVQCKGFFCEYEARDSGQVWSGVSFEESLGQLEFEEAYIVNRSKLVACDYNGVSNGGQLAGLRMSLGTTGNASPTGPHWAVIEGLPGCKTAGHPEKCTFDLP